MLYNTEGIKHAYKSKDNLKREHRVVLSDCNWTRTQNHLAPKRTLNQFDQIAECFFKSSCSHLNFRFRTASSKEVLEIQATIECGFTLKRVREMTRTYSHDIKQPEQPEMKSF